MVENAAILAGIVAALATAIVALYRARPQRDLDKGTKERIDDEVRRLQTEHDRRRTIRLLRLEKYIDADVIYHRRVGDLLQRLLDAGCLPEGATIPDPPQLPEIDDAA